MSPGPVQGKGQLEEGEEAVAISAVMPDGTTLEKTLPFGSIELIHLDEGQTADMEIKPSRNLDVGLGKGKTVKAKVEGGVVGLIVDARGRPLVIPSEAEKRRKKLVEWYTAIDAYPQTFLTG